MELERKAFPKLFVRTAVVITTISERGISNAAPFSFNSPISFDPPLYGFSCNPAHDTWRNIQANGEFVVNVVGKDLAECMYILEADYPYEDSEIAHAGLTEAQAKAVKPPRIREALAWIECKLEKSVELGDHIWITGRVVAAEVKDEYWKDAGLLDVEKAKLLCHIAGESFVVDMKESRYKRAK
jgi:flavin reductase (DIM6/NTAB) family NADH-FMN oxidoreductase RutF